MLRSVLLALVAFFWVNTSVSAQSHPLVVRQVVVSTVGERSALAIPQNANLEKFPLMSGKLSNRQMAELGLRPQILKKDWVGLNFDRKLSRFVYELIPAGDIVLVDAVTGEVVYRESCGNRLIEMAKPAVGVPPVLVTKQAAPAPKGALVRLGDSLKESAQVIWTPIGNGAKNGGRVLGWFVALTAGLALIPALVYGMFRFARRP
jgi:hypothetical protein